MRAGPHHRPERGAGRTVPAAVEDTHLAGARTLKGPGERGCGEGSCVGSTGLQTEVVPSHPVCDTLSSNPACLLLESFLNRLRVRPACQSLSPWDYLNGVLGSASLHSLPSPAVSRRRPGLCLLWFSQAGRMAGLASEFSPLQAVPQERLQKQSPQSQPVVSPIFLSPLLTICQVLFIPLSPEAVVSYSVLRVRLWSAGKSACQELN